MARNNPWPVYEDIMLGRDEADDVVGFLEDTNAYSTGDIAQTEQPTRHTEDEPDEYGGDLEGPHWKDTDRGREIWDGQRLITLYGLFQRQPGLWFFSANPDSPVGFWDGDTLSFFDADGNEIIGIEAGEASEVGVIRLLNAYLIARRSTAGRYAYATQIEGEAHPRLVVRADGQHNWADGTVANAADVLLRHGGTGRMELSGGTLGSSTTPAYIKPPRTSVHGPASNMTGIGTTFTDIISVTLTTTRTADLDIDGYINVQATVATAGNGWEYRVLVDGVSDAPVPPIVGVPLTGLYINAPIAPIFESIAAGTHTIKLQARARVSGDTLAVNANRAVLRVRADGS